MSEVIIDLADELLDLNQTFEEQEKAIMLSVVAWNLSLLDQSKIKQDCYPSLKRFILNFEVLRQKDGFHLNVASSLVP
ncbi:MAG: hypothetical protein B7Y25_03855 [Alphaproteobacteria bacterium 16-39-46]|nr:MAG: hypothetical protein B7Y25_03855 [Alphaproteobacteria bacterium 16-39-46]OZA43292.1 MAG: hypothetical protein B7X84_03690 [Alphaproteobacteria bacterium 17-39-52]HQS84071.1 hypothetical protein [Alphaproteobacteria bacterium]HQS93933.1 hypothetical protein [Alphaproteobacteria bacterium]